LVKSTSSGGYACNCCYFWCYRSNSDCGYTNGGSLGSRSEQVPRVIHRFIGDSTGDIFRHFKCATIFVANAIGTSLQSGAGFSIN
jgi:hypothetical protein